MSRTMKSSHQIWLAVGLLLCGWLILALRPPADAQAQRIEAEAQRV